MQSARWRWSHAGHSQWPQCFYYTNVVTPASPSSVSSSWPWTDGSDNAMSRRLWRTHGQHRLIHIPRRYFPSWASWHVSPRHCVVSNTVGEGSSHEASLSSPGIIRILSGTVIFSAWMWSLISGSQEFPLIGSVWGIVTMTQKQIKGHFCSN